MVRVKSFILTLSVDSLSDSLNLGDSFAGALFLAIIAFIPSILFKIVGAGDIGLLNTFTSTGLLIVVNVALEFDKALQNQIMMRHYKGFLD